MTTYESLGDFCIIHSYTEEVIDVWWRMHRRARSGRKTKCAHCKKTISAGEYKDIISLVRELVNKKPYIYLNACSQECSEIVEKIITTSFESCSNISKPLTFNEVSDILKGTEFHFFGEF